MTRSRRRARRPRGFTLLELLVSIAIMSIVVALAASPLRDAGRLYLRARQDAARMADIIVVSELLGRDVRASTAFLVVEPGSVRLRNQSQGEVSWRFDDDAAWRRRDGDEEVRFSFPVREIVLALNSDPPHARHLVMRYRVGESSFEERGFSLRVESSHP